MDIFNKFDAILAAYSLSKAKHFASIYKGRLSTDYSISDIKDLWYNVVYELHEAQSPEKFFSILDKRNSEKDSAIKETILEILNGEVLIRMPYDILEYIDESGYRASDDLIQKLENEDFTDIRELFAETIANSRLRFKQIQKILFNYNNVFSLIDHADRLFSKLKTLMMHGRKTDSVNNKSDLRHAYDELFGSRDRIVLPIEVEANAGDRTDIQNLSADYIKMLYVLKKYFASIGDDREVNAISNFVKNANRYSISKDENPLYTGRYKFLSRMKEVRIGKILNAVLTSMSKDNGNFTDQDVINIKQINTTFNQREVNQKEKICLVLSRHPYDIAGMSTGRGWTSCQSLDKTDYISTVATTIEAGALICYLCRESDTIGIKDSSGKIHSPNEQGKRNREKRGAIDINIQNPLGRVLVKTYTYKGDAIDFVNKNFVLRVSFPYGTMYKSSMPKLQQWLDQNWNNRIIEKFGAEELDFVFNDGQYFDRSDTKYFTKKL